MKPYNSLSLLKFISDCLWSAFFTSKRQKPSHHVKVAVHGEGPVSSSKNQALIYSYLE
jgi:hypothetical protein